MEFNIVPKEIRPQDKKKHQRTKLVPDNQLI